MSSRKTMTAEEAAEFLGVKVPTVYAYVSRGLIDSIEAPDDPRARRYRRSDLERLKRRSDAHGGRGAAAAGALDWGAPSIDTRIGEITASGPRYRGELATRLSEGTRRFEEVAEFLWTGDWPADVDWPGPNVGATPHEVEPAGGTRMIERWRVTVAGAALRDLGRFSESREGRVRCARRIYAEVLGSLLAESRTSQEFGDQDVVGAVIGAYGLEGRSEVRRAIRTALILVADHGMNVSTFAARVTASTGADLWASVEAAMTAMSGPKHGGAADRCEALLDDVRRGDSARELLFGRLSRGAEVPGFGHPLYPDGDPRFRKICTTLPALSQAHLELAAELEDAADSLDLGAPTVDLGLALLADALEMRPSGASTLFALGRMAGWIAHAIEQYAQGHLLRPRANYVGS
ncbi:MAG: citrate synthase family protein [Myxococcota bacterium]